MSDSINADDIVPDPFDTELQTMFAAMQPSAGFEDRLVAAVRQKNAEEPGPPQPGNLNLWERSRGGDAPALPLYSRLSIPTPVKRAAIAAAAVLMVGAFGYVGTLAMNGPLRVGLIDNHSARTSSSQSDRIESGDLFSISVENLDASGKDFVKQVRVPKDGYIGVPRLGQVKAAGLTEDELAQSIQDAYHSQHIADSAVVTISVLESVDRSNRSGQNTATTEIEKERGQTPFLSVGEGADHWDFSGGSNGSQNWTDWNGKIDKTLSYRYENPFAGGTAISLKSQSNSSDRKAEGRERGQTTLSLAAPGNQFGDATRVSKSDAMNSRFAGAHHDNAFTGRDQGQTANGSLITSGTPQVATIPNPYDNIDSVLLPSANQVGEPTPAAIASSTPTGNAVSHQGIAVGQERGQTPLSSSVAPLTGRYSGAQQLASTPVPQSPFFKSAGPDGDFNKTDDGIYSFGLDVKNSNKALYSASRETTVGGLVQDAREFIDTGKYAEGLKVLDNIERIDPTNAYAGNIRQALADKADNQRQSVTQEHLSTEFTHQLNDAKGVPQPTDGPRPSAAPKPAEASGKSFYRDAKGVDHTVTESTENSEAQRRIVSTDKTSAANQNPVPYDDIVRYSPDWPKVSEMRDTEKPTWGGEQLNGEKIALATPAPVVPNAPSPGAPPAPVTVPRPVASAPAVDDRKIIRTGSMEFDVDRFDTAQMQITKIVGELGGFVGATDSQKLPNGKVRGSISVRVAPERLDVLVLSLRALGDLKAQQITAADITKEYTDIQSELAADRAMQDRLLELIHDGKGSVKDLLAAENELGTWRTKIEKAEGMIRYYNGQVALSTLSITMTERDIQTPATAIETETADVGIEADDVEKARNSALKAIDDVKGRIVEAELKRFDAGQLAARLVADVPPESAGAVIDQLKQLGKVARLEIHRQETNGKDGEAAVSAPSSTAPLHTERKPTRLLISIYNLANVAPRRTTNVSLAAADVEAAYTALVAATKSSGGRVVTSALDRGDPIKATGSLVLEFPPDKFDAAIATLHGQGEVLNLNLIENPDTQNSTDAKAGLTVKLVSLANVAPRRTTNVSLAANDVSSAYAALVNLTKASGGRVVNSTLDQGDPAKATGSLLLELPPEKLDAAITTLHAQGEVLNLNLAETRDTQNSTDAKVGLTVRLISMATVKPLETVQQTLAAVDVPAAYQAILTAAGMAHARVQSASLNEQDRQNITGEIDVEVPRVAAGEFDKTMNAAGGTISRTSARLADADGSVDSKVLIRLTITSADHVAPRETTKLLMEVSDVDKSAASAQAAAITAGGRVLVSKVSKDHGQGVAWVGLDFPLNKSAEVLQQVRGEGTVRGIDASRDAQAPSGAMAHAYIEVEFRTTDAIVADQTGPWASVRQGLATSIHGLLLSLQWIVVGLCLVGPWAGIGWAGWKVFKRKRPAKAV